MGTTEVFKSGAHWLKEQIVLDLLSGGGRASMDSDSGGVTADDGSCRSSRATVRIQQAFDAFGPSSPTEIFTDEEPPILIASVDFDNDFIEIDGLLGLYDSHTRTIKIFQRAIAAAAKGLKVDVDDLTILVRIHEYGHAVVHLSTDAIATEWDAFLSDRGRLFASLDNAAHELLAQLITWNMIGERRKQVFSRLMPRQPAVYHLDNIEQSLSRGALKTLVRLLHSTHADGTINREALRGDELRKAVVLLVQ